MEGSLSEDLGPSNKALNADLSWGPSTLIHTDSKINHKVPTCPRAGRIQGSKYEVFINKDLTLKATVMSVVYVCAHFHCRFLHQSNSYTVIPSHAFFWCWVCLIKQVNKKKIVSNSQSSSATVYIAENSYRLEKTQIICLILWLHERLCCDAWICFSLVLLSDTGVMVGGHLPTGWPVGDRMSR